MHEQGAVSNFFCEQLEYFIFSYNKLDCYSTLKLRLLFIYSELGQVLILVRTGRVCQISIEKPDHMVRFSYVRSFLINFLFPIY